MEQGRDGHTRWAMLGVTAASALIVILAGCSGGAGAPDEHAESDLVSSPTASAPVVSVTTVQETEVVPFAATSVEDPGRDVGTSAVTTAGQNGVRTKTYSVTTTDGVETNRELVSDVVTTPPVDKVTSVGSRQPAPPTGACDPNYSDASYRVRRRLRRRVGQRPGVCARADPGHRHRHLRPRSGR